MPDASLLSDSLQNDAVFANQQGLDVNWGTAQKDIISALQPSWIWGGPGDDQVSGSAYTDWFRLSGSLKDYWWQASAEMQVVIHDFENSRDGNDSLNNIEWLQFHDATVDLTLPDLASQMDPYDLQRLSELYVGFFNRVPEADGMRYWIEKFLGGSSLLEIADQFYEAGIYFGVYAADMTEADFITEVYANALGRTGLTAPDESEVGYWENWLAQPGNSKGGMVLAMLNDVHTFFSDDPEWGFVSELLENKAAMAQYFAIERGISYRDPLDNIQVGRQMAGEITPEGIEQALAALGLPAEPPAEPTPEPEPVAPVNTAPTLAAGNIGTLAEDTQRVIDETALLTFASDNEQDSLRIVDFVLAESAQGTLELTDEGEWTFTPEDNLNGTVFFSVTVSDGEFDVTNTLNLDVTPVNDAPVLPSTQSFNLLENGRVWFDLDATDIEGSELRYSHSAVQHGTITTMPNGEFIYTPNPQYWGEDSVSFFVWDEEGAASTQTIQFLIEPRNSVPVANADSYQTRESARLNIAAVEGVLANDQDDDNDPLTVSTVQNQASNVGVAVDGSNGGTFWLYEDGRFEFDPVSDFNALYSGESRTTQIVYQIADGEGGSDSTTLTVTVNGEGTRPVDDEEAVPEPAPAPEPVVEPTDAYNIAFNFLDAGAVAYQAVFTSAAAALESIINEGLSDVSYLGETIDDLKIDVSIEWIDGEYGVLGSAGPDLWRSGTFLPYYGSMRFDSADMASMASDGILADVIIHEMLHVLGVGTLWQFAGLVSGANYVGDSALREYQALAGDAGLTGIPLTTGVGAGSDYSHWDEGTFDTELMTPFIDFGSNPLSRVTVGALEDLGYTVDYSQADSYALPAPLYSPVIHSEPNTLNSQDLLLV